MSGMQAIERVVGRRLVKRYGSTTALRGVDVTLERGELTVIEGANGSGKSTLLGILGTVIRATSGDVDYEPIGSDRMRVRASMGWVAHDTLSYPDLTGRQNIELAARFHGLDAAETWERVQDRFGLGTFADRPVRTCSRGQRQRIALARALVHRPTLVLLDEPSAGLDREGVARLLGFVQDEVRGGAVVAIVSHEPDLFRNCAAARIRLERGRVISGRGG